MALPTEIWQKYTYKGLMSPRSPSHQFALTCSHKPRINHSLYQPKITHPFSNQRSLNMPNHARPHAHLPRGKRRDIELNLRPNKRPVAGMRSIDPIRFGCATPPPRNRTGSSKRKARRDALRASEGEEVGGPNFLALSESGTSWQHGLHLPNHEPDAPIAQAAMGHPEPSHACAPVPDDDSAYDADWSSIGGADVAASDTTDGSDDNTRLSQSIRGGEARVDETGDSWPERAGEPGGPFLYNPCPPAIAGSSSDSEGVRAAAISLVQRSLERPLGRVSK